MIKRAVKLVLIRRRFGSSEETPDLIDRVGKVAVAQVLEAQTCTRTEGGRTYRRLMSAQTGVLLLELEIKVYTATEVQAVKGGQALVLRQLPCSL